VEVCGLSAVRRRQLGHVPSGTSVDEATMQALLEHRSQLKDLPK